MSAMTDRPAVTGSDLESVDLADPRLHAEHDLTELWLHLRASDPVYWHPGGAGHDGFWVITRHRDVAAVYRDTARFSSEHGNVLDTLLAGRDTAAGQMLAVTNGQRHARLRALVARGFTAASLKPVIAGVRSGTRRLITEAVERGSCDFASEVAAGIPLAATCDLLGVPQQDRSYILSLTSSALGSDHGVPTAADTFSAKSEILLYFADLASQRRRRAARDLVSVLVSEEVDGCPLTEDEIIFNCYSILLGGDETTRLAMIGAVLALVEHPTQWRAVKDGSVSVESAAEEMLRWTTPALHSGRTATGDFAFAGKFIEQGDIVTIWPAAANRDDAQFADPDRLDLSRNPNRHLAFAHGPHFCIGSYLARVEITAVLTVLRELAAQIELAGPPRRVYSNFLSGMCSLPVTIRAERAARPPARSAGGQRSAEASGTIPAAVLARTMP